MELSFSNPIGYAIVIAVILFVAIILFVTRKKENIEIEQQPERSEKKPEENKPAEITGEKTDIFYFRKKDGIGIAKEIYPRYFKNGSALVVTPEGNYLRKKMKHCFV